MKQLKSPLLYAFIFLSVLIWDTTQAQITFQEQNTRKDIHSGIVCGVVDINGDYYDDLLVLDQTKNLWLGVNNGKAYFFWQNLGYYSSQSIWSVAVADLDRNGQNDIILGGDFYGIQVFYQNSKGFRRDTVESSAFYSQASSLYDINKDGWIDFTICDDNAKTRVFENKNGELINNYSWLDLSKEDKINEEGNYGCLWTDLDQDGDGDLYISKCSVKANERTDPRRINLFYQQENKVFTERAEDYGLNCNEQSWTTVSGDLDGDGKFDLIVANHHGPTVVYIQNRDGRFDDRTIDSEISLSSIPFQLALEDWDNDGDLDLLSVGSGVELWLNEGTGVFKKSKLIMDYPDFTSLSWGDLNGDGSLDMYTSYAGLINNPSITKDKLWLSKKNENHWVSFGIKGRISNDNGIGALMYIHTGNKMQVREVQSGTAYGLQKTLNVHLGLGDYNKIDSMFIHWSSGVVDRYFDLPVDQFYLTGEGSCITPRNKINPRGIVNLCLGEEIEISSYVQYDKLLWNTGSTSDTIIVDKNGAYFYTALNKFNCPIVSENTTLIIDPNEKPELNISGEKILCENETLNLKVNGYSNLEWSNKEVSSNITANKEGFYFAKYLGLCREFMSDTLILKYNEAAVKPNLRTDTLLGPSKAILNSDLDSTMWYNTATETAPIGIGKDYETDKITASRSFWARSFTTTKHTELKGGMKEPLILGFAYPGNFLNPKTYFESYKDLMLDSITVYTDSVGERKFEITLRGDTLVVASRTQDLVKGKNRIYLGFLCKAGLLYSLSTNAELNQKNFGYKSPRLERSNYGFSYPFIFSDICKISSSEFGDTYYYGFFDWQIHELDNVCFSEYVELPVVLLITSTNNSEDPEFNIRYDNQSHTLEYVGKKLQLKEMSIFSMEAKLIAKTKGSERISNLNLISGVYAIQIRTTDGQLFTRKLVIQQD
ncbi:MAG: FG-GAP-like repeat-containing protein [Saprospiraceae bacterium]